LTEQLRTVVHTSNLLRHPHTEALAERLTRLTGLAAVFYANSGTEANEAALKLARAHHHRRGDASRTGFVALEGSFHGRTMGALSVTHTAKYRTPFEPLIPGVTFVPPEDVAALGTALEAQRPAALILEPIQGESGVRALSDGYLRAARELCTRTGTVLIHDEVQSGSGRTGSFLAADAAGVKPDVVTLAKPLAAGLPMGALVVAAPFADALVPGDHGTTFGGGALACRAALVFLEELEERGLLAAVRERGEQLHAGLAQIAGDFACVAEVRGRGLIAGLRFAPGLAFDVKTVQQGLLRRRVIATTAGPDVLRLLPPYVVTAAQIEHGLEQIARTIEELRV
jgi:acetylornithine/N-succinyldiaminopimelate aminotransferase